MAFQVHGYFEDPNTSKSREIARFTYRDDLKDLDTAYQIASDWVAEQRYPFVFIQDTVTKISNQLTRKD